MSNELKFTHEISYVDEGARRCPDICEVIPAQRCKTNEYGNTYFREIHWRIGNCVKCKSPGKISREVDSRKISRSLFPYA